MSIKARPDRDLSPGENRHASRDPVFTGDHEWLFNIAEKARTATSVQDLLFDIAAATGQQLKAHRCLFNEIDVETDSEIVHRDYCRDEVSIAGRHPISGYSPITTEEMKAGRTVVNNNSRTDPRTARWFGSVYEPGRELSYVAVPMMREGKWVASLWVSDDKPREWTANEIHLLETVAERTWTAVERVRAEAALRASEAKYRSLFESIDDGFCTIEVIFDENGKSIDYQFLDVNPAFERLTGIKNAPGKRMREIAPDHEERWFEVYGEVAISGKPQKFVDQAKELNRWYDVYAFRVGEFGERTVGVLFKDVTEQKGAQDALAFLAAIIENSDDAIISKDLNGVITSWNKSAEKLFGYTSDEAVGQPVTILIPPERQAEEPRILDRIRRGEPVEHYDTVRRRKDGSSVEVSLTVSPIRDAGRIIGASKIARDISERKQTEDILNQNRAILSLAMQSGRMGVWERDIATDTVWWSEELEAIFGLQPGEFDGTEEHYFALVHEDDREKAQQEIRGAIAEQRPYSVEFRFHHADGSIRWMEGRGEAVYSEKGEPVRLYGVGIDITDRKRHDEKLLQSEKRFQGFMHHLPGLAWIKDLNGRYVFANDAAERTFGVAAGEIVGKSDAEIFSSEVAKQFRTNDETALRDPSGLQTIETVPHSDGTLHHSVVAKFPIAGPDGAPLLLGGMAIDVTEEKRAEQALRDSEEKFRLLSDTAPALIWLLDPDGQCVFVNRQFLDFAGATFDELSGTKWRRLLHRDDAPMYIDGITAAQSKRMAFQHRVRAKRRDGQWRWLDSFAQPLYGAEGEYLGHVGISPDITVAVEAEEAIRASQAAVVAAERKAAKDYQQLLERIVPLGQKLGTARDLTTIYRAVQEFACSSMECSGFFVSFYDPVEGLRLPAYVWGEGAEIEISELPPMPIASGGGPNSKAILEKRTVINDNYWEGQKDRPHVVLMENGKNPESSIVVPMMVKNSVIGTLEVQTYSSNAFDLEQAVALEMVANLAAVAIENVRLINETDAARNEAESANRTKDEFLSVLSHELRTPLNAILGWVRMYRLGIVDQDHYKQSIDVIERNANLQNGLIEDLLDVSRIISGKMRIEHEMLDVVQIAGEVAEGLRPVALNKEITLELSTGVQTLFIEGDHIRLQQAISNLVQNAVKFTPRGGSIRIAVRKSKDRAEIKVTDSGIGIEADFLPHIFERFRQADASSERSFSGLGLGLTIVRTIVELHGGNISVESEGNGKGATFTVALPLAADRANGQADTAGAVEVNERNLSGVRVLLVDDNYDNVLPLQMFLGLEGAEVATASSAAEALEKLEAEDFNLLISDIGMPEMDGFALISQLRNNTSGRNNSISAIAVTAYASSEDKKQTRSAGFQGHVSKPIDFGEVIRTIKEVLASGDR
jgi:PAS domain S-box-containing protein